MLIISKSIEELDREFAEKAGITYEELMSKTLMEQNEIRRKITNKSLKLKKEKR